MVEKIAIIGGGVGILIFVICAIAVMLIIARRGRRHNLDLMRNHRMSSKSPVKFSITRQEIIAYAISQDPEKITAKDTLDPQFPYSLKWKTKSIAMLYGTDKGVLMTTRIHEDAAKDLGKKHDVQVAKFPRGKNWYFIPIDDTFHNKEQVFEIVHMALGYAQIPAPKVVKEKPAKKTTAKASKDSAPKAENEE